MIVASKKITVPEFLQMDFEDEDAYYELINGDIVKKTAPTPRHQQASLLLASKMLNHTTTHQLGKVFTAPIDVFLDNFNQTQPDILFVEKQNLSIIDYKDGILGAPDLVVEIISPSSYVVDRFDKKKAYATTGVKEYWLIDPSNHSVEIYQNTDGQFDLLQVASGAGLVRSEIMEGFELEIADIFPND